MCRWFCWLRRGIIGNSVSVPFPLPRPTAGRPLSPPPPAYEPNLAAAAFCEEPIIKVQFFSKFMALKFGNWDWFVRNWVLTLFDRSRKRWWDWEFRGKDGSSCSSFSTLLLSTPLSSSDPSNSLVVPYFFYYSNVWLVYSLIMSLSVLRS